MSNIITITKVRSESGTGYIANDGYGSAGEISWEDDTHFYTVFPSASQLLETISAAVAFQDMEFTVKDGQIVFEEGSGYSGVIFEGFRWSTTHD